jgi:oligopeptide transport system substrate-binding protein
MPDIRNPLTEAHSRRELLQRAAGTALLMSTSGLFAACGGGGATPSGASHGDAFRMITTEPTSLDPNITIDLSIYTNVQMFEPLYRLHTNGDFEPRGGKKVDVSKDGTEWTFTLDPAYKWSDGKPVTAEDYVYSWLRILDPKTASPTSFFLFVIKNAAAYNAGDLKDPSKVAIEAPDATTLRVTMESAAPQFRAIAALPYLAPVPKHVVERHDKQWTEPENIVTNGPYVLESRRVGQRLVLKPNPNYGGGRPAIASVVLTTGVSDVDISQTRAYEAGEVDFANGVGPQDVARIKKELPDEFKPEPLSATQWVQFDNRNEKWSDIRLRRALSSAIDRTGLVAAVSDGTARPAPTIVPEGILGANEQDSQVLSVDEARKLLADAGFPEGRGFPKTTMTISSNDKTVAELVQNMWRENLGIDVAIASYEDTAFRKWIETRADKSYDLALFRWFSDYEDPVNWYKEIFLDDPRQIHFSDKAFEQLVKRGSSEVDEAKRKEIFLEANRMIEERIPMIPLYHNTSLWLRKPYLEGLEAARILGLFYVRDARFA